MAEYKIVDVERLDDNLKSVANSIRARGNTTGELVFPEGFNAAIRSIPQEGGGSGIIDITELPTDGIDESAVYRLTENIQLEKTEIYFVDSVYELTVNEYFQSLGVPTIPNVYVVDDISNMKVTDVQTFSEIHLYILRSNGIVYANVPSYGGTITCGLFGWQDLNHDHGFTEDIYAETEDGVYTTIEAYKQVQRWFVRKNGEWEEITAYTTYINEKGFSDIQMYSGDMSWGIPSLVIAGLFDDIDERWFILPDGSYYDWIKPMMFYCSTFKTATIPHFMRTIGDEAFMYSDELTTVTFKRCDYKYMHINSKAFSDCRNLTTINVPWSEGEVAGAPWGATNATINYNYTEG